MYVFYVSLIIFSFIKQLPCLENNVCSSFGDYYTIKDNPNCKYDIVAAGANVIETALYYGYKVDTHKVIMPDKYILTIFRILTNDNIGNYTNHISEKYPVFIQHGYANSALTFLARGKDSLPFVLADAGYDVWLGNTRGNEYAEEHINLTVYDAEFWNYNLDDIVLHDLPAELQYVSEVTTQKGNIIYIGHSLGTTYGLMYAAAYPKVSKDTVKLYILLSPIYKIPNTRSPILRHLKTVLGPFIRILEENDLTRILSQTINLKTFIQTLCLESPHLMQLCFNIANLAVSGSYHQTPAESVPVFFNVLPSGVVLNTLSSLADVAKGNFRKFDYGVKTNIEKYGSKSPPDYDISRVETPFFLFYGINDYVCGKKDAMLLYRSLPSKARYGLYGITETNFNHGDFLYGKNAKELVYYKILKVIHDIEKSAER